MRNTFPVLALLLLLATDAFSRPQPPARKTLRDSVFFSGDIVRLPEIAFENGKSALQPGARDSIVLLRNFLQAHPDFFVEIGCHTDAKGSDSLNLRLSQERARLIYDSLQAMNVSYARMSWKGYGEKEAKGVTPTRRTELKIMQVRRTMQDTLFNAGDVIPMPWVIFYDARFSPKMKDSLESLLRFVQRRTELTFEISSHTDVRGSDKYNDKLSQVRAQAIADFLISKGVYAPRIIAKGYGETQFLVEEPMIKAARTKEEMENLHQLNRRIDLKVITNAKQGRH